MKTIHKFALDDFFVKKLFMPQGAKPLHVAVQHNKLCLWAAVDTTKPLVEHEVEVIGTGWDIPTRGIYIGTVITETQNYVWHLYYLGEV